MVSIHGAISTSILILMLATFLAVLEAAFICSNKFKIELLNNQEDKAGKRLAYLLNHSLRLLTALKLVQIFFCLIFACTFFQVYKWSVPTLMSRMSIISYTVERGGVYFFFFIPALLGALIFLLNVRLLPKLVCKLGADSILYRASFLVYHFYFWVSKIIQLLDSSLHIVFVNTFRFSSITSIQNVLYPDFSFALKTQNPKNELSTRVFVNALDFNKVRVREFMVPRTEIVALPITASITEAWQLFKETELSRIVVFEGTLDSVKGFIHSRSLFESPSSIQDILQPILMVPESMPANHLLQAFNKNRKSIAVVIDEFGGTAGLVTVEDLVEVVFGDIQDEYDIQSEEQELEKQLDENTYLFSARLEINYINEKYNLYLPEGEYTTLAGLVLFYTERIPQINDTIAIDNYLITIIEATAHKVNTVKIEKVDVSPEEIE
ncbi:MAG: hemolysin family protein [Bacteroidia bacterium]|nr:hemolysin family protein [Bacteroidia bacterium]